jgi:Uma2 family endonuclease
METILKKNWTYDEYIKINDDKRYEIINGDLCMNPSPLPSHQRVSTRLLYNLTDFVYSKKLGEIFHAPCDVILSDNVVVQPDILFISNENSTIIQKKGIFGSPELVIEIVSPSSLKRDNEDKRLIYQQHGIKEYWIIFPSDETIEVLELGHGIFKIFDYASTEDLEKGTTVKSKILDGLEIDLKAIF